MRARIVVFLLKHGKDKLALKLARTSPSLTLICRTGSINKRGGTK